MKHLKTLLLSVIVAVSISAYFLVAKKFLCKSDIFSRILEERYSGYKFDSSRLVTKDQIKQIVKAAQLTPSSYNDQPWYFIICDRTTHPDSYNKALSTLVPSNQKWAKDVPVLIITIASTNSRDHEFNKWAQYDTGAAAFGMMLQATALGLMAHQMGGFDEAKVIEIFKLPKDMVPMAIMAIGYSAEDRKTRSIARERKSLKENFFIGNWGANANFWED